MNCLVCYRHSDGKLENLEQCETKIADAISQVFKIQDGSTSRELIGKCSLCHDCLKLVQLFQEAQEFLSQLKTQLADLTDNLQECFKRSYVPAEEEKGSTTTEQLRDLLATNFEITTHDVVEIIPLLPSYQGDDVEIEYYLDDYLGTDEPEDRKDETCNRLEDSLLDGVVKTKESEESPEGNSRTADVTIQPQTYASDSDGIELKDLKVVLKRLPQHLVEEAKKGSVKVDAGEDKDSSDSSFSASEYVGSSDDDDSSSDEDKSSRFYTTANTSAGKKPSQFHCLSCPSIFDSMKDLLEHKRSGHSGESSLVCYVCQKEFNLKRKWKIHVTNHWLKDNRRNCPECGKKFDTIEEKMLHRKTHHARVSRSTNKEYPCPKCGKILRSYGSLRQHQVFHGEKKHQCSDCGSKFYFAFDLRKHVNSMHIIKNKFRCGRCKIIFKSKELFMAHREADQCEMKTKTMTELSGQENSAKKVTGDKHENSGGYPCAECGKVFKTRHSCFQHKKYHKEKRFMCQVCGKTFFANTDLKSHLLLHPEQRAENIEAGICDQCGKGFIDPKRLKRHLRLHRTRELQSCEKCGKQMFSLDRHRISCSEKVDESEKTLKCSTCGKRFFAEAALKLHEDRHLAARLQCEFCSKKFSTNGLLVQHRRKHVPEERLPCTFCPKTFRTAWFLKKHVECMHLGTPEKCPHCKFVATTKARLLQHMVKHSSVKKFQCSLCDKAYKAKTNLKRHVEIVHEGKKYPKKKRKNVSKNDASTEIDKSN